MWTKSENEIKPATGWAAGKSQCKRSVQPQICFIKWKEITGEGGSVQPVGQLPASCSAQRPGRPARTPPPPSFPPQGPPGGRVPSCTLPSRPPTSTSSFRTYPPACPATIPAHVCLEPSFLSFSIPGPLSLLAIPQGPPPE